VSPDDGKKGAGLVGLERGRTERDEALQLVAFIVGPGHYALDIMRIKEIINPVPVTPVPKAPAFIEGVIELRGAILPIVDLRKRFELPQAPPTRASKFLIVAIDVSGLPSGGQRMIVGLVVDGVLEPLRIARDQVKPPPPLAQGAERYFTGVVQRRRVERRADGERPAGGEGGDRMFMLLDLDAVLSSTEKVSLSGLGAAP
jgi:purine-binding chemotaxis protein CheW